MLTSSTAFCYLSSPGNSIANPWLCHPQDKCLFIKFATSVLWLVRSRSIMYSYGEGWYTANWLLAFWLWCVAFPVLLHRECGHWNVSINLAICDEIFHCEVPTLANILATYSTETCVKMVATTISVFLNMLKQPPLLKLGYFC